MRIEVNASMEDEIGLYSIDSLDVYITKTPLTGDISGGASVVRKWNTNVTIDALLGVSDPDVEPGNHTGMTWR